jgi:hypothetical protein
MGTGIEVAVGGRGLGAVVRGGEGDGLRRREDDVERRRR